jgi:hypothetical protein
MVEDAGFLAGSAAVARPTAAAVAATVDPAMNWRRDNLPLRFAAGLERERDERAFAFMVNNSMIKARFKVC